MILSYRDEPGSLPATLDRFLNWLDTRSYRSDMNLCGLSKYAVNAIITSMLGGSPAPVLAMSVFDNSEGNPLHVIETLKELVETHPDTPLVDIGSEEETLAIPAQERLTQILSRRLDRFSAEANQILFAGAILGISFRADELEQLCGMPDDVFLQEADLLLRSRILEEDPFQSDTYRFTHAKLQESVKEKIPPEKALELHHRAIEVLENIHSGRLPAIASRILLHCIACGIKNKIMEYHLLASDYADSLGNQIDALEHLEKAIDIIEVVEMEADQKKLNRLQAEIKLGSLLRRTGTVDRAEQILTVILANLDNDEHHTPMIARTNLQLGSLYGSQGKISQAVEHLNKSLALCNRLNDQEMIIDCYINLGASFNYVNDGNSQKYSAIAMEKAQLMGDNYRLATAMINLGVAHASSSRGREGLPYLRRAVDICDMIKSDRLKSFALMTMASCYFSFDMTNEYANRILELTDSVIKTVHKTGDSAWLADCLYKRSIANHFLGHPVIEDLDRATTLCKRLGQEKFVKDIISFKQSVMEEEKNDEDG